MGSFAGHIDEGIFFLLIAVWWIFNMFRDYIKQADGCAESYESKISYDVTFRGKRIPLEIYLKILFPFCGFAAELLLAKGTFHDTEGNFVDLAKIQHMTIYILFVIHGISDLLQYFELPVVENMNYFTAGLALFWYGTGFYYHSMPELHKPPLENTIHRLPIPIMYITIVAGIAEMTFRNKIFPQLVRCFCVLTLGTWFTYISFILYLPSPFPGNRENPAWDQHDMRNVQFIVAAFGMHLTLNVVFMMVLFSALAMYRKLQNNSTDIHRMCKYNKLNNMDEVCCNEDKM